MPGLPFDPTAVPDQIPHDVPFDAACRELLETSGALVFVARPDGTLALLGTGLARLVRLDPTAETTLTDVLTRLLPAAGARRELEASLSRLPATDELHREIPTASPRGDLRPVRWSFRRLGAAGLLGVGWDASDRFRLEHWVRFQSILLAHVREAAVVVDLSGRVLHWGGGAEALLGLPAPERLERPFHALFPVGTAAADAAALLDRVRVDGVLDEVRELRRADGAPVRCRVRAWMVPDHLGTPQAAALLVAAEPAPAEAARGEGVADPSDPFLAVLARTTACALVVTDAEGRVTLWNRAAERIGGRGTSRAVGRRILEEVLVSEDLTPAELLGQLASRGRVEQRIRITRPNGTVASVDLEGLPLPGGGAVLLVVDQTEPAVAAQELRYAKEAVLGASLVEGVATRLGDLVRSVDPNRRELLGHVEELAGIVRQIADGAPREVLDAQVQALGLDRLERDLEHVLYEMGEGTWRLSRMAEALRQLLDLDVQAPRAASLGAELDTALDLVAHRFAGRCSVEVALGDLPLVRAVCGRLVRAFGCLLLALVEVAPRGAGELPTVRVAGEETEGRVVLAFSLNAEGFGMDVLSRLSDLPWLAARPGMGPLLLGLAREEIRAAGGALEVDGAVPGETGFRLGFPTARATAAAWAPAADAGGVKPRRISVLLVEDDDLYRRSLERHLSTRFDVRAFPTVTDALGQVAEGRFAAAVLGFPRPEGFGLRILARLAETNPILFRNTVILLPPGLKPVTRERLATSGAVPVARSTDDALLLPLLDRLVADLFKR